MHTSTVKYVCKLIHVYTYLEVASQLAALIGHLFVHIQGSVVQPEFCVGCLISSHSQLHTHTRLGGAEQIMGKGREGGCDFPTQPLTYVRTCSLIPLMSSSCSLALSCILCCKSEQERESGLAQVSGEHCRGPLLHTPQTPSSCSGARPPFSATQPQSVSSALGSEGGAVAGGGAQCDTRTHMYVRRHTHTNVCTHNTHTHTHTQVAMATIYLVYVPAVGGAGRAPSKLS